MQQTNTYQLNLVESTDTFSPQPINENTEAIDALFKTQQLSIEACAKMAVGSYTGTGTSGAAAPNTLTFGFTPKVLLVLASTAGLWNEYQSSMLLIHPMTTGVTGSQTGSRVTITWGENFVSWYGSDYIFQMNSERTYYYFAIG